MRTNAPYSVTSAFRGLAVALALAALTARADLRISAPAGMPVGKTISAEQFWQEFDHTLPAGVWVSPLENREYEIVSAHWMRRSFLPALAEQMKVLWAKGIPQEDSAGNCSGFALVFRLMLGLSAMESHARAPATATVVVYQGKPFGGLSATQENHCVALVLTDEGPWIVEAQSGAHIAISEYPNLSTIKLVSVH